jgi:DNA-binding NarL/FixJ family response regulator
MGEDCVLIVARETLLRSFVVRLLETTGSRVVAAYPFPQEHVVRQLQPTLVCVDLTRDERGTPFAGLRRLRELLPLARIVAFTNRIDRRVIATAKRGGADVVLGPEATEADLLAAARAT